MEIIGYGILLAIGWGLAPIIISSIFIILSILGYSICVLFDGCK